MRTTPLRDVAKLALDAGLSRDEARKHFERALIVEALERKKGNVCRAAKLLRLHRNTMSRMIDLFGMTSLPRRIRALNCQQRLAFMRRPPQGIWVDAKPQQRSA